MSYSYRDLIAWRKAKDLPVDVYRATNEFPKAEIYGLVSQMRRAAVSVPSNIAEGQGRCSRGEFRQFLGHARGSLLELQTQIIISTELEYIAAGCSAALLGKCDELLKIINGLADSMLSDSNAVHSKLETRN